MLLLNLMPDDDIGTLVEDETDDDDEILEVSSIGISTETDSGTGELHEIDVSFQSGNTLSLIFSGEEKEWVDKLFRLTYKIFVPYAQKIILEISTICLR